MKLTMSEKYMFCNQMAMILESGFSLNQGVTMVYEEMDDKNIKGVLQEVAKYLDEQVSFSEAIDLTKAFDDYMVNLVKVGETSGNLDDVMQSLSEYYARIDDITNKLKQALTYPIILIIMMVVVVGIIVFKVFITSYNINIYYFVKVLQFSNHRMILTFYTFNIYRYTHN